MPKTLLSGLFLFALASPVQAQNLAPSGYLVVGPGALPTTPVTAAGDAVVQRTLVVGAHGPNGTVGFPANNGAINAGDAYVKGTTWLNGNLVFRDNDTGNHRWVISATNSDAKLRIGYGWDWNKGIECQTSGDVKFFQKVSIGDVSCTTPGQCPTTSSPLGINTLTLAVGGKIGARYGVHVTNAGVAWPDYVFDTSYLLQPLPDVARFIAANHHLPGVPSAEDVKTDGVELVTMQAVLLQKIEELTLHLIRLEAENAALKTRVQKLEI